MKTVDTTAADQQILTILAALQATLDDAPGTLEADELMRVRQILKHGNTLIDLARYEEAKGLIRARWRGLILGLSAVLTALVAFWTNVEKIAGKIAAVFQ